MKNLTPLTPIKERNATVIKNNSLWEFIQKILLSISSFFFLLFIYEIFILNPNESSFLGYHTEKYFFYLYFLLGLFSLHKIFFWTFLSFIILSMLPMMIPFLMLIHWLGRNDKQYPINEIMRAQEYPRFGQHTGDLVFFKKVNPVLEKIEIQFNVGICNIENLSQIKSISLKDDEIKIIFLDKKNLDSEAVEKLYLEKIECLCEINLKQNFIKTSLDTSTYKIKKDGIFLKTEYE